MVWQKGGGVCVRGGTLTMATSKLEDNRATAEATNLYLDAGSTTTYVLPAPPGFWVPATKCEVWREACGQGRSPAEVACRAAAESCKGNLTDNVDSRKNVTSGSCQPTTFNQPCDWRNNPALLGETVYVLPLRSHDQNYPFACAAGVLGGNISDTSQQTSAACAGLCPEGFTCGAKATVAPKACPKGHYCPEGTSVALPCSPGSYSNSTSLISANHCTPTDAGHFAPTGSTQQTPCSPGTVAPNARMGTCRRCEAGTFQAAPGKLVCEPCTPGSYCAEGAAAALPCKAGTYQSATMLQLNLLMTSADDCLECPVGTACGTGAAEPSSCSPGTVQPDAGMATCDKCVAGTYQPAEGKKACIACESGSYCPEGASASRPCAKGSYSNATNLTSADECTATDVGHFAPTGSTEQTPCSAGTVQPRRKQPKCDNCAAGKFMNASGRTECHACAPGSYCPEGASAPLSCSEGTYSNKTDLGAAADCIGLIGGPAYMFNFPWCGWLYIEL